MFNHEHLSHVAQFLCGIFIYLSEKAKLPQWMCIFLPFPSLRKKTPHFMVSKELLHSLFSMLLSAGFWKRSNKPVRFCCDALQQEFFVGEQSSENSSEIGGLISRVCYFGISAEGAGSGNFIQGKVPHERRVCEVTHFSFLGFFPPLNCLTLLHSGLGAHLHVCGDVWGYEVVTKLALT